MCACVRVFSGTYALSVLDCETTILRTVKHYRIRNLDAGRGYYISTRKTFPNLHDLVEHYSGKHRLTLSIGLYLSISNLIFMIIQIVEKYLDRVASWYVSCC